MTKRSNKKRTIDAVNSVLLNSKTSKRAHIEAKRSLTQKMTLDDNIPHITGTAICIDCRHIWQAVAPLDIFDLECPDCGEMNGYIDLNLDSDGHYDDMDDY